MRRFAPGVIAAAAFLFAPMAAMAASNDMVAHFTHDTLTVLIGVAGIAAGLFLIRGGYMYITSTGKPDAVYEAKRTIRLALIGLAIVIGAAVLSSFLNTTFTNSTQGGLTPSFSVSPNQVQPQPFSISKLIQDSVVDFLQNLIQSATKPVLDGIIGFLTNTPSLAGSSTVFNLWLVMVGITDSLFALVIALLGFHVMSASTFGFEELTLKELFPRIGIAFVVANTSIFLIDWIVSLCQMLVQAVLAATGGLGHAWIVDAFNPATLLNSGSIALVTLIMMTIFVILAIALLLFYIVRLMILALGAVLSPILCLLWLVPRFNGFVESLFTAYLVIIFSLFVHIVIMQLGAAFLTLPGQTGSNPFISVLIGIALLSLLLKSTSMTIRLALASQTSNAFRKTGKAIINTISSTAARAGTTRVPRPGVAK